MRVAHTDERKSRSITVHGSPTDTEREWLARKPRLPPGSSVRFALAPRDRGTEVHVTFPAEGRVGRLLQRLSGKAAEQRISRLLRHFKQLVELGFIVHSDASIHRGPHPARPATPEELQQRGAHQRPVMGAAATSLPEGASR
jgi:hypothetical protein